MLRVWGKIWKGGRVIRQWTAQNEEWRQELPVRFERCLEEIIYELDLPKPIWLEKNHRDIETFRSTEFRQEHFIEQFPYTMFEIEIIETDEDTEEIE